MEGNLNNNYLTESNSLFAVCELFLFDRRKLKVHEGAFVLLHEFIRADNSSDKIFAIYLSNTTWGRKTAWVLTRHFIFIFFLKYIGILNN